MREDKLRQADGSLAMWAPPSDPAGDPAGPMEKVCVVHKYKHLGTWLTSDGLLTFEMKHRAASACGALVALERTVLGKKGCSWEMQCQFACVDAATQRHCSASQAVSTCIATNRGRWLEIE